MWIESREAGPVVDNTRSAYVMYLQVIGRQARGFFPFPRVEKAPNSQVCGGPKSLVTERQAHNPTVLSISRQSLASSTHACEGRGEVFSTASA
jgi:hypothetical protein